MKNDKDKDIYTTDYINTGPENEADRTASAKLNKFICNLKISHVQD